MRKTIVTPRYEVWDYDGSQQSVETIGRGDVLAIDKESVDHFLSVDLGIWGFRTADGRWIEYDLSQTSLGPHLLKILDVVRCEPGQYFSPRDVAELTGLDKLAEPNNLSARWRALRLAHQESFGKPHFFLSKRTGGMGIAWNAERSFMQIIRIRPDGESVHVHDGPGVIS
jgi:hypothetical protein